MTPKELELQNAFARGMVCAASMMIRRETEVAELLRACGMTTVRKMRAAGVDEQDIDALRPLVRRMRLHGKARR